VGEYGTAPNAEIDLLHLGVIGEASRRPTTSPHADAGVPSLEALFTRCGRRDAAKAEVALSTMAGGNTRTR
jgi:hypothetical protein